MAINETETRRTWELPDEIALWKKIKTHREQWLQQQKDKKEGIYNESLN